MEPNKKLVQPAMKPLSPNMKAEDAYIAAMANLSIAITALVERMEGIEQRLDEIGGKLSVMSRYAQRKGESGKIWKDEDSELLTLGETDGAGIETA